MYRHISIFTLKNKDELDSFLVMLKEVGQCELIRHSETGVNVTTVDSALPGPDFGDVIQMIDFDSLEDLKAYPNSKEHLKLLHEGAEMLKVTAIDYKI